MAKLAPYLPPHLVRSLARRGVPVRLPHVERFPAALLYSDISGFTALTERLQALGREGAEEMAVAINAAFAPAIGAIEKQGGSIVSFGGDALFAIFPGAAPVARAVASAEAIGDAFATMGPITTTVGPVKMAISQAIHYGEVLGIHLGGEAERHYLTSGAAVAALARLEARAPGGKQLISLAARAQAKRERGARYRPTAPAGRVPSCRLRSYLSGRLRSVLGQFEGEYRRLAVLFLETRGGALAALNAFFLLLGDVLDRCDGVLLKTDLSREGTKWVCVCGLPQAHEDDVERAACAAIEIRDRSTLEVRGGLHEGVVVNLLIGTRSRCSYDVMGDVVNTAARTLQKAPWGEVWATGHALQLLRSVETDERGLHLVKGKGRPLELHALLRTRPVKPPKRALSPLVGREAEVARLRTALVRAGAGMGSVMGIEGEPGIGKSRLARELARLAVEAGFDVHEGRAASFGGASYGVINQALRHALGLEESATGAAVLSAVRTASERFGLASIDMHHLAEVMGARFEDSPLAHLDGRTVRANNAVAVGTILRALASVTPQLVVLEDMHWSDELTRETVAWLVRDAAGARAIVLLVFRPELDPPEGCDVVRLPDLTADSVDRILAGLLGQVPPAVSTLIKDKGGGNPLYLEEVVRHLVEAGLLVSRGASHELVREPGPHDVPDAVELIIKARYDRLSRRGRRVAQLGAVVGRSFSAEDFEATGGVDTGAIEELELRELIDLETQGEEARYVFRHDLIRDVIYGTLLVSRRRRLHRAIAKAIEARTAPERSEYHALLAHHWHQAGHGARARRHYLAAGRRAASRHAHEEAERLYLSYLRLIVKPSAESLNAQLELAERVLRVVGKLPQALEVSQRAIEGAQRLGRLDGEASHQRAMGIALEMMGRVEEASERLTLALELFRRCGSRLHEAMVLADIGALRQDEGRHRDARRLFDDALAAHRSVGNRIGEATVTGNLALLCGDRGSWEEADLLFQQALTLHREQGSARSEATVCENYATFLGDRGRHQEEQELHEQALAIARRIGARRIEGVVLGNLGALRKQQGCVEEARELYGKALELARAVHDRRLEGHVLGNLAMLHLDAADTETARLMTTASMEIASQVADRRSMAFGKRQLALVEIQCGRLARAEELLQEALALCRELGEPALEAATMCELAELSRRAGDLRLAQTLVEGAQRLVENTDSVERRAVLCQRAHIMLAEGSSARSLLEEALHSVSAKGGELLARDRKALEALEAAVTAQEAGRLLFRGEVPERLPEAVRRCLGELGELSR